MTAKVISNTSKDRFLRNNTFTESHLTIRLTIGIQSKPVRPTPRPVNTDNGQTDATVGDFDDILMFTTRSTGRPFVGLF